MPGFRGCPPHSGKPGRKYTSSAEVHPASPDLAQDPWKPLKSPSGEARGCWDSRACQTGTSQHRCRPKASARTKTKQKASCCENQIGPWIATVYYGVLHHRPWHIYSPRSVIAILHMRKLKHRSKETSTRSQWNQDLNLGLLDLGSSQQ